jgi:hypothetical protein
VNGINLMPENTEERILADNAKKIVKGRPLSPQRSINYALLYTNN